MTNTLAWIVDLDAGVALWPSAFNISLVPTNFDPCTFGRHWVSTGLLTNWPQLRRTKLISILDEMEVPLQPGPFPIVVSSICAVGSKVLVNLSLAFMTSLRLTIYKGRRHGVVKSVHFCVDYHLRWLNLNMQAYWYMFSDNPTHYDFPPTFHTEPMQLDAADAYTTYVHPFQHEVQADLLFTLLQMLATMKTKFQGIYY